MDKETILDYATETPRNTNRNVLRGMLDNFAKSGGSSDLPAVTSEDNGKVLTVVSGAWAKAQPQSGGVVIIEPASIQADIITLNESYNDIAGYGMSYLKMPVSGYDEAYQFMPLTGIVFTGTTYGVGYGDLQFMADSPDAPQSTSGHS